MTLSGNEREKFRDALLNAFPSYSDLEQMVSFELNQNLEDIAGSGELKNVVFNLIKWAEKKGKLEDLIRGAYNQNSGNQKLRAFAQQNFSTSQETERLQKEAEKLNSQEPPRYQRQATNIILPVRISRKQFLQLLGFGGVSWFIARIIGEFFQHLQLQTFPFETVTVDLKGKISNSRNLEAKYFVEDLGNNVTLEMLQIPGRSFTIGAPVGEKDRTEDEGPLHTVRVATFFMGKFEVTQTQYQQVMSDNPSRFIGDKRPVENVSWNSAVEFCNKLSKNTGRKYRLPSEAEWEYACRAGTTTPFHFGETITTKIANYRGTDWNNQGKLYSGNYGDGPKGEFRERTTDVGTFPPNAFGLYDMHGNVWEWCQDTWHDSYKEAPVDGSAWVDNKNRSHIVRGGSWGSTPNYCRSANRGTFESNYMSEYNGFRVVCIVSSRT